MNIRTLAACCCCRTMLALLAALGTAAAPAQALAQMPVQTAAQAAPTAARPPAQSAVQTGPVATAPAATPAAAGVPQATAAPADAAVPPAAITAALALARDAAIVAAATGLPANARIDVTAGAVDSRLRLAPCARIEAHVAANARPWGQTRVGLRCVQGATPWNVWLPVTVKVFAPALVSNGPLAAGAVIEAAHLRTADVDWAADASPAQTRSEPLLGRTLARAVAAGQALRAGDLRPRLWFSAGDTVRIVASGNGFSVSGEGQALSNGIEGQPARVRTDSGRLISGQPAGDHRIEVAL